MFVISNAADVIPRGGLVTAITLVHLGCPAACSYLRIFLSGDLFRNHVKVHHVVTRRSLVALSAVERAWGGMLEIGNSPCGSRVALGALRAEQPHMPIFGGVASDAVEGVARGALIQLTRDSNA